MIYRRAVYTSNGQLAIHATTDDGEPYATVTVNLEAYGIHPAQDWIFIPAYKFTNEFVRKVTEDLGSTRAGDEIMEFYIGEHKAKVLAMKLRKDWKKVLL
jgi:hypothetical protein